MSLVILFCQLTKWLVQLVTFMLSNNEVHGSTRALPKIENLYDSVLDFLKRETASSKRLTCDCLVSGQEGGKGSQLEISTVSVDLIDSKKRFIGLLRAS